MGWVEVGQTGSEWIGHGWNRVGQAIFVELGQVWPCFAKTGLGRYEVARQGLDGTGCSFD